MARRLQPCAGRINESMKLFFRFLRNNPLYALINVVGLALSLMFVILLGDYTYRQFSIDRWHHNHKNIQVVGTTNRLFTWPQVTHEMGEQFPEIEKTCCVNMQLARIKYGDNFTGHSSGQGDANVLIADSTFFDFFDFRFVQGDKASAMDSPEKCVITESLARKLFNGKNPLGEPLNIVGTRYVTLDSLEGDPYDSTLVYTVSAVIKDFDKTALKNSTEVIVNFDRHPQILGYTIDTYALASGPHGGTYSFIMTRPGNDLGSRLDELTKFSQDHCPAFGFFGTDQCALIPLDELMFAPQNDGTGIQKGDRSLLGILLAVVLAILLFAVSNYINLTVANTGFRAKEVATRRLLGGDSTHISLGLISESTLMVLVSFLIGFALALLFEDKFAEMFQGKIDLVRDLSFGTVGVSLLFILITGVISGILPTLMLMKFKPIDIVKGSFRQYSKMTLSKVFIIIQNIITVTMLTATLTILLQINHLVNAPLGYNTDNIFFVNPDNSAAVRDALESQPFVKRIGSYTGSSLDGDSASMTFRKDRDQNNVLVYLTRCDKDFLDVAGFNILEDYHLEGDVAYFNEAALKKADFSQEKHELVWGDGKVSQVAGVFADFHLTNVLSYVSPFEITVVDTQQLDEPYFMVETDGSREAYRKLCALVEEADGTQEDIEWKVRDLHKSIEMSFSSERSTMRLVAMFTCIAILISVLGFIGMSLFFIRQRRKEIGVRKIMGSTTTEVLTLLMRKFCAPLLISLIFAAPLSWYLMDRWLQNFSYRIGVNGWIFVVAAVLSLLVAAASIFFQTLRAARSNPSEAIRTE